MEIPMETVATNAASVEKLIREIFDDLYSSQNGNSPLVACKSPISYFCREQMDSYKLAVDEIENIEKQISEARAKQEEKCRKILQDPKAGELIRLKRRPVYESLEKLVMEKYPLLQSDDLLPDDENRKNDFRLNDLTRKRWKKISSITSNDSLFKVPKIPSTRDEIMKEVFREERKSKVDGISSRSMQIYEKKTKPRRSIIKSEQQKTILVARPLFIEFKNFQLRTIYKESIVLMNVSNAVAKFHFEPMSSKSKFSIEIQSRSGDRKNLAPGICLKMITTFSSDDLDDYEERLIIKVDRGKDVCIILKACRDLPILTGTSYRLTNYDDSDIVSEDKVSSMENCAFGQASLSKDSWNFSRKSSSIFSSESSESNSDYTESESSTNCGPLSLTQFECRKCFVGEQIMVATRLQNVGGDGKFFVMSEFDWNSMNINDVTTENFIILSCFALWPVYFALKTKEEIDLVTFFYPSSYGVQVDKLYVLCDNLAVHPLELIGDGVMYDPSFVKIGKNEEKYSDKWSEDPSEGRLKYILNLGFESTDDFLKDSLTITNTSGLEIYYRWEKIAPEETETREESSDWKDFPLEFLNIRPNNGIFNPCSSITFKISVRLMNLSDDRYRAVFKLILVDIPLAAVPTEYEHFAESCTDKRRFCENSVDVMIREIELLAQRTETSGAGSIDSSASHATINGSENGFELHHT